MINTLHRLVTSTFIENTNNNPVVNHNDGCKNNNCILNLEWCSIKQNNQHNHNIGLIKRLQEKLDNMI
jgi:hypothetical protein